MCLSPEFKISMDSPTPLNDVLTKGGCICGAVSYEVVGIPILAAYCHCTLCQRLNASAFIHTVHFPAAAFAWTHSGSPQQYLDSFNVPIKPWKTRWRCKTCGCTVASYNSKSDKWSVWGAQLERNEEGKIKNWDIVKPTAHIFYESRMLDIGDSLGKWTGYENTSERIA